MGAGRGVGLRYSGIVAPEVVASPARTGVDHRDRTVQMQTVEALGTTVRARKRVLRVDVRFAEAPQWIDTLEGRVHVRRGDAIVTGIEGERWPVSAEAFARRYTPADATVAGCDGPYLARPVEVRAQRMPVPFAVPVGDGTTSIHGVPGDWRVDYGDGDFGIVSATIFDATYERLD